MPNLRNGNLERKIKGDFRDKCKTANKPCWICRQNINYNAGPNMPDSFEPDHYHPVKTHPHLAYDITNLRPSHSRCNRSKGAKLPPSTPWIQANW